MSARGRDVVYVLAIGANIVSMTLSLVQWRPTSSPVGVTLGAVTIITLILARSLSEAHLAQLGALIRKADAETVVHQAILEKVRSGEATIAAEGSLRTM